ncbi:helix-turn-helix domain-containing protein [Sphingobacterium corticibacter]|uniref:XRE family transcriptional regulator n=1 Tax=Sphingobacterium corticibacter TaxID=2171749 RepID=A0A2T8HH51_9SPHI|nr:helix-turn-helix domain-containing protein [Sphingobacterium corticibacter]PVH24723.1 XRE family transcriptional regulator [Sphingobacterium corticibacter]
MNSRTHWYLIDSDQDYEVAVDRYEEIKRSKIGSEEHKEKLLLVHLISEYEKDTLDFPDVDPIELIKIRMEDLNLRASDLAKEYGDKGTVSKVLNYKQSLSITMIRLFSNLLSVPIEYLAKEYELRGKSERLNII